MSSLNLVSSPVGVCDDGDGRSVVQCVSMLPMLGPDWAGES